MTKLAGRDFEDLLQVHLLNNAILTSINIWNEWSVRFPFSKISSLPHITASSLTSSLSCARSMHMPNSVSIQHLQLASWTKQLDRLALCCKNFQKEHVVPFKPTNSQKKKLQEHVERPRQPQPRHPSPSLRQLLVKGAKQESPTPSQIQIRRVKLNRIAWKRLSAFSLTSFLLSESISGPFYSMERLMATPLRLYDFFFFKLGDN